MSYKEGYKTICKECGSDEVYATWEVNSLPINEIENLTVEDFLQGKFYMDYVECYNCKAECMTVEEVKIDETKQIS